MRAEAELLGKLARARRDPPHRARAGRLLAAQLRRRAPALSRHRGPGLDDHRRGRGPGSGQARLRGRAGRRHHRAADQPPVRGRAAGRQARALGDRHRRERVRSPAWPSTSPATWSAISPRAGESSSGRARRPSSPPRHWPTRACARCSSPIATPTARARWPSASAARSARWTPCPPAWRRPTSSSPRPRRRTRSSSADDLATVMRVRGGRPLVLIDIAVPRDVEHACGEIEGVRVYDMDDLQAVVDAQPGRARGRAGAGRGGRGGGDPALRALAGPARRHADHRRAARARRPDRRPGAGRERGSLGVRVAAGPRAHRGRRAGGDAAAAARAHDPPQGERATAASSCCASSSGSTRRRPTPSRRRATRRPKRRRPTTSAPLQAPGVRIGTRASALALAQARQVAARSAASTSWSRWRRAATAVTPRRQGALGARARRRAAGRRHRLAVHSAKDVPAVLRRRHRPRRRAAARRPARRAVRRGVARRAGRRARAWAPRRCAAPRSCAPSAPTSTWSSCAATSTPGCASWPRAATTRSSWPPPGWRGWAAAEAGAPLDALVPAAGQGALAVTTRTGEECARRGDRRRRATRALRAERASSRARGRLRHAGGAHARPSATAALRCAPSSGPPDGSAWVRDELDGATEPERARRRGRAARLLSRRRATRCRARRDRVSSSAPARATPAC